MVRYRCQYKVGPDMLFIYLFGILRCFQHCTGRIMMGSWKGRGNQYIQLVKVLYCKLPTNGNQLPLCHHPATIAIGPDMCEHTKSFVPSDKSVALSSNVIKCNLSVI